MSYETETASDSLLLESMTKVKCGVYTIRVWRQEQMNEVPERTLSMFDNSDIARSTETASRKDGR